MTAANFWDKAAKKYAASPIADMAAYDRTIARTKEFISSGDHVLEIGCGTGGTAVKLAESAKHLTATDISQEMLKIAAERHGDVSNVSFEVSNAKSATTGTFDVVCAFSLLHLVPDTRGLIDATFKAVKPGGYFISKTPCLGNMNFLIRLAIPALRLIGKAPDVSIFSDQQLAQMISDAGFEIVEHVFHNDKTTNPFIVARRPK